MEENLNEIQQKQIETNQYYQSIDEMADEIYHNKKRKNKMKEVELDARSIRVLSFFLFSIFGLLLGTFVFSDYITITLIGMVAGIIVGQVLVNKQEKEVEDEEISTTNDND